MSGAGYFSGERYTVNYTKEGYAQGTSTINSSVDGWYWGNILFGGLIGMLIVDPMTGAMYKLPRHTSSSLKPIPPKPLVMNPNTSWNGEKTKEQLFHELAQEKDLPYAEYQRRYQMISRMP